jgi:hypothetical protein
MIAIKTVTTRYGMMAKEAFDRTDAEARRK